MTSSSEARRLREEPETTITEWAVQYEHGVHTVDDRAQAEDWRQYLPKPNWVVCRTVTFSSWRPASELSS